jgi:hypothetical protein
MKKVLLMLMVVIPFTLKAQTTNSPIIDEIAVKTSAPKSSSGWGYGSYCVFVRVRNFDGGNKSHWDAIKNFSRKYCNAYRDKYFSLYFIDGDFNAANCDCELNLKDNAQWNLFSSKVIAYISLRLPDNPTTGERRDKQLDLGELYNVMRSDPHFTSICGIAYPYFYPCN